MALKSSLPRKLCNCQVYIVTEEAAKVSLPPLQPYGSISQPNLLQVMGLDRRAYELHTSLER